MFKTAQRGFFASKHFLRRCKRLAGLPPGLPEAKASPQAQMQPGTKNSPHPEQVAGSFRRRFSGGLQTRRHHGLAGRTVREIDQDHDVAITVHDQLLPAAVGGAGGV